MALRILLVVAGLAAGAWALHREAEVRACDRATLATFRVRSDPAAATVAARIEAHCRGAGSPSSAAAVLARGGRVGAARELAALAVQRGPEDARTWVAAGLVARAAGDARSLGTARARLRALDPRSRGLD